MLDRKDGKLRLQSLDLQIFLADLYAECKNEHEVEWLQDALTECVEGEAEERLEELE
jgi:hypothetical protein